MINKHFILKNNSIEKLHFWGFKNITNPDNECKYFKYKFPVHKYKNRMVLECELTIDYKSGEVFINIYDNNKNVYAPYHNREYGNYIEFIEKINKEILKEFKKLEIEEI